MDKISAQNSLASIDNAISDVTGVRADFGAMQARLQSTINNLQISAENLSAAKSRIRDADYAKETAELTRNNVKYQAGTSVLAQANTNTRNALTLVNAATQG
jgi:flagellin